MPDALTLASGPTTTHTRHATPGRRDDIEGLRALAVALIVIYHLFFGRVSGGVDVFFVVSGFLVTTMLLGHMDAAGRVRPIHFAARTSARLVPAVLVVVVAVACAVVLLEPPWRQPGGLGELVWAATFNTSWLLSSTSVDYLAQGQPASPIQHLWALSLQVRFYAVWLVLLGAIALFTRRGGRRTVLIAAFALVILASFAYSIHLTALDQPRAYFNVAARLWEFAAGGLLAVLITGIARLPAAARAWLGWVGLALIMSCGVVFSVSRSFPGWAALWPVAGALLVIAGGAGSRHRRWSPVGVLSHPWLVWLGGISFALYLWHWPLLVFYRDQFGQGAVDLLPGLGLVLLSVALAFVTTRFVEHPVRSWAHARRRVGIVVAAAVAAIMVVTLPAYGLSRVSVSVPTIPSPAHPGAGALTEPNGWTGGSGDFAPDPVVASEDFRLDLLDGCGIGEGFTAYTCTFGVSDGGANVMLVGGSHSAQWFPAIESIARSKGWSLTTVVRGSCRFALGADAEAEPHADCGAWRDGLLQELLGKRPDLVITTATVSDPSGETVPPGYIGAWQKLADEGIPVVAIRDTPRWSDNPLDCLSRNPRNPQVCQVPRAGSLSAVNPALVAGVPANVGMVDMTDVLCRGDQCPAVIGNVVVYMDDDHITASYARTTRALLDERLRGAARQAGASATLFGP